MHHEVHIIQKYPLSLMVAFDMSGSDPGLTESLLNFIRDGLYLPRVAT
jgi:hypothetical protein